MDQEKIQTASKRDLIRSKLRGSLGAWKLNPIDHRSRNVKIEDRTPEPGVTQNHFDQMFQLGRKIGEGASGTVYECTSKRDGKLYAVKISRGDVELLRITKRTFKILKELNHPSIIKAKCLYLNEQSEKIHFVMEHCPYPSLAVSQQNLSYAEKKEIVKQVIEGLNYLHSEGVCHRDIKFDNILYNESEGKIKIIDFGISKKIYDKNKDPIKMWTNTGTLSYMAPEMLTGAAYDQKVDMWSLGVLTYKMFIGRFPFDSEYKSDMIDKINSEEPEYQDDDAILNDFLRHLLHKDPRSRLSASQCLKHPWIENDLTKNKDRLGSGQDFDFLFEFRLRNYSVAFPESPEVYASREDRISELKQLNIFQQKRKYRSVPDSVRVTSE